MNISRLITGLIMIIGGFALIVTYFLLEKNVGWVMLIYGVPIFIIGIVILLNKKEDKIEEIKSSGGKKWKT